MTRLAWIVLGSSLLACLLFWHLWQDAARRAEESLQTVEQLRRENAAVRSALELHERLTASAQTKKEEHEHALERLGKDDSLPADQRWDELDRLLRSIASDSDPASCDAAPAGSGSAVPSPGL